MKYHIQFQMCPPVQISSNSIFKLHILAAAPPLALMSTPSPRDETEGFPEYGDSMKVRRGLQLSSLSLFVSSLSHLFHICFLKSACLVI